MSSSQHNNTMFTTKVSSTSTSKTPKKQADTRLPTPTQSEQQQQQPADPSVKATGRWTRDEHFRFLEALKMYGKEWKKVQ